MSISKEALFSSLSKAKNLMSEESDYTINQIAKANSGNMTPEGDFVVDESVHGYASNNMAPQTISPEKFNQSKLPKEILRELRDNPINIPSNGLMPGDSILDGMPQQMQEQRQPVRRPAPMPQRLPEQRMPASQPVMASQGVDYGVIKAIIDESIRSQFSELKNQLLSEGSLKAIRLAKGNRIQLIDNSGNLYESTLSFKKNVSRK